MAGTDAEYLNGLADWFDAVRMQYTDIESGTHDPAERLRAIAERLDGGPGLPLGHWALGKVKES